MRKSRVLKWSNSVMGDQYYDIRTDGMLRAAALAILQTRMDLEFFPAPNPIENDRMYRKNIQRRDTLLIALNGNSDSEAFSDMHEELAYVNRRIESRIKRQKELEQEHERILQVLNDCDGHAAVDILAERSQYDEEFIEIILPHNCGEVPEKEDENAEISATTQ